jgi:hypothetical protein
MIGLGRLYSLNFTNTSVSAQQDFFYVKPAADKICIIESIQIGAAGGTADAGDAQEELWDVELIRLPSTVTAGTGGTSVTSPPPMMVNDAAQGFTARTNDTGKATTTGTATVLIADGMNNRIPYIWVPPPEHRVIVANAQAIVFRLNTTPADAILLNGTMLVREMP